MFCYQGTCTNTKGDSLPNYYVECTASGVVQDIYADNSGTPIVSTSGVANKAKTDARGNFFFYVAGGTFILKYYDNNGVYQFSSPEFSVSNITTIAGVDYFGGNLAVGSTPDNIRYEMNSGGQPVFVEKILHVASVGADRSPLEGFTFNNTSKPATVQFGKNRGDGTEGSATFGRKSLALDRIFLMAFYGGKDSDGTTTAFCHAGYLGATAEADNSGANELDTYVFLRPGSTSALAGAGNGLELNSKMQAAFAGPNIAQYGPQQDHAAVLRLGPGSADMVALRLTPATLKTTPLAGGIELDSNGRAYITDNSSKRDAVLMGQVKVGGDSGAVAAGAAAGTGPTIDSVVWGEGCVRITLTTGTSTTTGTILTITYPHAFASQSFVFLQAANAISGAFWGRNAYTTCTASQVTISTNGTLLTASTQYAVDVFFTGN